PQRGMRALSLTSSDALPKESFEYRQRPLPLRSAARGRSSLKATVSHLLRPLRNDRAARHRSRLPFSVDAPRGTRGFVARAAAVRRSPAVLPIAASRIAA